MTREDIIEQMVEQFKYNDKDNQSNTLILEDWLDTKEGFERYKDFVKDRIDMACNSTDLEYDLHNLKKLSRTLFIEDMLYTPGVPIAKEVIDSLQERAEAIWEMVLNELSDKHELVAKALDESDDEYEADLSKMGVLFVQKDFENVEAYDLDLIWQEILDQAVAADSDWMDTDPTVVAEVVR